MLSAGVAVAAARLADPSEAGAQRVQTASAESQLRTTNSELRRANGYLSKIQSAIGPNFDYTGPGLRKNTKDIAKSVEALCRAAGGSYTS
jgi:hypothetical protein